MTFRIAVAQPRTAFGDGARERNLATARAHLRRAAGQGADLVCFPESFPGEWRQPVRWTPLEAMQELTAETGVHVVCGYAEPLDEAGRRCFNTLSLLGPDGVELGRYRRTTPEHAPWIYRGGAHWDFEWVPAEDLPVFDVAGTRVGLLMCSEVYVPELARVLALRGAEIIALPAGLAGPHSALFETWRTVIWSRAIENLACTAVSSNLTAGREHGLAMICSPEEVLLEAHDEGVFVAAVDLDRLRWLREETDSLEGAAAGWRTKPGLLRDWRRRAVLEALANRTGGGTV
jgi:predicted amidohydrolase